MRAGPRAVSSVHPPAELMRRAGYSEVDETDVTDEYLRTQETWTAEIEARSDELLAADPGGFDQQMADARETLAAIRDGLLRRSLVVASRPGGR